MATFVRDLRLAFRRLRASPGFGGLVVLTLALGIGLNTAVFAVVDALLLRPLPGVRAAGDLVQLYRAYPGERYGSLAVPDVFDLREPTKGALTDLAAWTFATVTLTIDGVPRYAYGQLASANYFRALGVDARLGRTFGAGEDTRPGAHPVVVLSHGGWQRLFGGDPGVVGRTVVMNGAPMEVVGVTPPGFAGTMPILEPAFWVPLMQLDQIRPGSTGGLERRTSRFVNGFGRLAPGVGVTELAARLETAMGDLRREYPDVYERVSINLVRQVDAGIHPTLRSAQVGFSAAVMGVVAMLLLLATVNVTNLFLARARDRAREMAIRQSIGASRGSLVRLFLTDSLLHAGLGGAAGLAVASLALTLLQRIDYPFAATVRPDLRLSPSVIGFCLIVSFLTAILVGLLPALRATRPSAVATLRGEAMGGIRSRASRALVVAQVALSLVLLASSGIFVVNLRKATRIDKGFTADRLALAGVDPALQGYSRARSEEFQRRLVERLGANPAVKGVGFINQFPLGIGSADRDVVVPGYVPAPAENMSVHFAVVSPAYFETMGIRILRGRGFTAGDDSAAAPAVVVNERFAARFWPGMDPVGRIIQIPTAQGRGDHTVIGVVPTGKYQSLGEAPRAFMYFPQSQAWRSAMTVVVATAGDPAAALPSIRAAVRELDPDLPLADPRTLDRHLGVALLPARLTGWALAGFGLLGLILATIGTYGVTAHTIAQRTREIGVRMAIGADAAAVVRLGMADGLRLIAGGAVLGLAGAVLAARLLRSVLLGGGGEALVFGAATALLVGVAAVAIWVPSRRAARLDPVRALRAP
ncbi:MAG: ABC transporter permease [Gemmatimonadetes bacterium]|nr:ABC transporter permease [Gemmatimonadota bacterium]